MANKRIYLAGKIGKHDWRETIVENVHWPLADYGDTYHSGQGVDISTSCPNGDFIPILQWPILSLAAMHTFDYVGPYFISDDHGCYHGDNTHGNGNEETNFETMHGGTYREDGFDILSESRRNIFDKCMIAIDAADIVFAWLNTADAFGTYAELGYAKAKGKTIFIGCNEIDANLWFIYMLADGLSEAATPKDALQRIIDEYGFIPRPIFDSPLEEKFWDEWQRQGGARHTIALEYQYKVPGTRYRLDFANLEEKVAIELDGYEYHNSKEQFTKDRQRQRDLEKEGWRFIRFSGSEIWTDVKKCFDETSDFVIGLWYDRNNIGANVNAPNF